MYNRLQTFQRERGVATCRNVNSEVEKMNAGEVGRFYVGVNLTLKKDEVSASDELYFSF